MSNTPKSKRSPTKFEAEHNFYALRDQVTQLMLIDFGFSEEKFKRSIEKYRNNHKSSANVDEVVTRYQKKSEAFTKFFIDYECKAILDILRDISREFTLANSIYPSNKTPSLISEYCQRRKHLNEAIGLCYTLKQEIQYVIRALPIDMNKYKLYDDLINKQIALFKGVRKADNRFLKSK